MWRVIEANYSIFALCFFLEIDMMIDMNSQYRKTAHYNVTHRRRQNFYALPTSQWQMLAAPPFNFLSTLDRVDEAIDANADLASEILMTGLQSFGLDAESGDLALAWRGTATVSDMDKVRTTIRQMYRDWSAESLKERQTCYGPVLQDVQDMFGKHRDKSQVKILVPGAGLGRLVFEFCSRGYSVEGNEISYHQLMASNWVLNHTKLNQQFDLYPFALEFSNVVSRDHQLRVVKVPDVHPGTVLAADYQNQNSGFSDRMSMTAADFVVLYGDANHRATFDAVVTIFFIDTAPNIIRYIETIRNCLKLGGVWINMGPLLWHFADRAPANSDEAEGGKLKHQKNGIDEPGSIELTVEEVLLLVDSSGFHIERHELVDQGAGYIQNRESMLQNTYRTLHWIARKTR